MLLPKMVRYAPRRYRRQGELTALSVQPPRAIYGQKGMMRNLELAAV
jgi:hypothetical protein